MSGHSSGNTGFLRPADVCDPLPASLSEGDGCFHLIFTFVLITMTQEDLRKQVEIKELELNALL